MNSASGIGIMDRKTVIFGIAEEKTVRMDDGALIVELYIELMRQFSVIQIK